MEKKTHYFDFAYFGNILSGRDEGKQALVKLESLMTTLAADTVVSIDLSRVQILNPSYADETIAVLVEKYPGRVEMVGNISLAIKKSLETIEEMKGIRIPIRPA